MIDSDRIAMQREVWEHSDGHLPSLKKAYDKEVALAPYNTETFRAGCSAALKRARLSQFACIDYFTPDQVAIALLIWNSSTMQTEKHLDNYRTALRYPKNPDHSQREHCRHSLALAYRANDKLVRIPDPFKRLGDSKSSIANKCWSTIDHPTSKKLAQFKTGLEGLDSLTLNEFRDACMALASTIGVPRNQKTQEEVWVALGAGTDSMYEMYNERLAGSLVPSEQACVASYEATKALIQDKHDLITKAGIGSKRVKESKLQKQIIDYIEASGGYAVNIMSASVAGVSDILACYKGHFLSIEVKVGYNKASPLQLNHIDQVIAAGGIGVVTWDLKTVKDLLNTLH